MTPESNASTKPLLANYNPVPVTRMASGWSATCKGCGRKVRAGQDYVDDNGFFHAACYGRQEVTG